MHLSSPTGAEDVLLAEAPVCDVRLGVLLMSSVSRLPGGAGIDWESLPAPDLDAGLIGLRQLLIGDLIRTELVCSAAECGTLFDVDFRLSEYVRHHEPKLPRSVVAADEPGWFTLTSREPSQAAVTFRIPSCGELALVAEQGLGSDELARRCIRPSELPASLRRRAEASMEVLAPSLFDDISGSCPACRAENTVAFDPLSFVLRELKVRAEGIYEEVALIASRYHWSEREILALPRARRARYAELAQSAGGWS